MLPKSFVSLAYFITGMAVKIFEWKGLRASLPGQKQGGIGRQGCGRWEARAGWLEMALTEAKKAPFQGLVNTQEYAISPFGCLQNASETQLGVFSHPTLSLKELVVSGSPVFREWHDLSPWQDLRVILDAGSGLPTSTAGELAVLCIVRYLEHPLFLPIRCH